MEILGHSRISMTSKYAHVLPEVMTDAADALARRCGGTLAGQLQLELQLSARTARQLNRHLPRSARVRRQGLGPRTRGFVSVVPVVLGGLPPGSVPAVLGDSPRIWPLWVCLSFDLSLVPPARPGPPR